MSTMSAIGSGLDCRSHQLSSSIVPLTANSVATSAGGALAWGDVRFAAISRQMRNSSSRNFAAAPPVNSNVHSRRPDQTSLTRTDWKSLVQGTSGSIRVDLGGSRFIKHQTKL